MTILDSGHHSILGGRFNSYLGVDVGATPHLVGHKMVALATSVA